jgi:hypothetical protein
VILSVSIDCCSSLPINLIQSLHNELHWNVFVFRSVWTISCESFPGHLLNQGETCYSTVSGPPGSVASRRSPAPIVHFPGRAAICCTVCIVHWSPSTQLRIYLNH